MDGAAFVGGLFDEPLVRPQRGVYEAVRWLIVEGLAPLGFRPCACVHVNMYVCTCVYSG